MIGYEHLELIYIEMLDLVVKHTQQLASEFAEDEGSVPDDEMSMASLTHQNYGEMIVYGALLQSMTTRDEKVFTDNIRDIVETVASIDEALDTSGHFTSLKSIVGKDNLVQEPRIPSGREFRHDAFFTMLKTMENSVLRLPQPKPSAEQFNDVVAMGHYGAALSAQTVMEYLAVTIEDAIGVEKYKQCRQELTLRSLPLVARQNMMWQLKKDDRKPSGMN